MKLGLYLILTKIQFQVFTAVLWGIQLFRVATLSRHMSGARRSCFHPTTQRRISRDLNAASNTFFLVSATTNTKSGEVLMFKQVVYVLVHVKVKQSAQCLTCRHTLAPRRTDGLIHCPASGKDCWTLHFTRLLCSPSCLTSFRALNTHFECSARRM